MCTATNFRTGFRRLKHLKQLHDTVMSEVGLRIGINLLQTVSRLPCALCYRVIAPRHKSIAVTVNLAARRWGRSKRKYFQS